LIIEAASGESYADYIQNHIFAPLEMSHSYTSQVAAKQDDLAVGHQFWFWFPVAPPDLPIPEGSLPSGQLISTSEDMAHYIIAFLNDGRYGDTQILSGSGISKLHQGVAEDVQMGISMGKYAMGWYVSEVGSTKIVWHTGMVPDFSAYMALLPDQKKGVVLLLNADHFMMNPVLAEVGQGLALLLAGEKPDPIQLGFIPWMMRSLLLIPLLQIIGVVTTMRFRCRMQLDPSNETVVGRLLGRHVLLPLIPNLLIALTLIPMLGPLRGFWTLFMPDYSWIALICGGFAGIWAILRTWLVIGILRKR
jgi:hypothetical protein